MSDTPRPSANPRERDGEVAPSAAAINDDYAPLRDPAAGGSAEDLPSTQHVGSAAISAIELRPKDGGYVVTGIGSDGTVVSNGPSVEDLPMGIAVARGIVRLAEFQREGDLFRAEAI